MKETVILAPGANGSELLRSLAKHGVNTLGVRFVSTLELARIALMRSGISIDREFIPGASGPSIIFSFLNTIDYFKSASFADAEQLFAAINTMRILVRGDEATRIKEALDGGEFQTKNDALLEAYSRYMKICENEKKTDSIGIIRKAIAEAAPFEARFLYLDEFALMPLELELLEKVSEGEYEKSALTELFGKSEGEETDPIFRASYGSINEAERIVSEIFRSGTPLDECVVACADPASYAQIFYDITRQHNIPVTFGSGVPIINSNPARLLKLINDWNTTGSNGIDSLKTIILSEAFNRKKLAAKLGLADGLRRKTIDDICSMAGNLRLSFNDAQNRQRLADCKTVLDKRLAEAEVDGNKKAAYFAGNDLVTFELVNKLADELKTGTSTFIEEYSVIRPEPVGRIDQSAVNVISTSINAYRQYMPEETIPDIVPDILNKTVCSENSREGSLHITSIKCALSCLRKNLYVCGLSSANFPGTPTENYLLLDNDLLQLASEDVAPTSAARIGGNKKCLSVLLRLARLTHSKLCLSYSLFDLATLKAQNPSSCLYEFYEKLCPGSSMDDFLNSFIKNGYFENGLSVSEPAGESYANGHELNVSPVVSVESFPKDVLDREWSPSSLDVFFQCPRRFFLTQILGIPEEEEDDPFEVINAAELGTMAHSMMELLAENKMDEDDFLKRCAEAFDDFLKTRPPVHEYDAARQKKEFLRMMKNAYKMDPSNEVLAAEEKYRFTHPCGIKLKGYPDRVEKTGDGKYIIADYKTKRKVDHVQDDIGTCLQVVIYAWLCEQAGIPVSKCEYRYIRKNARVSCEYNDLMKQLLNEKLQEFKTAVENKEFEQNRGANEINCKYCKVREICIANPLIVVKEAENE